ncbi:MAG TPA: hypothetical protein VK306_00050 [Acidimicrobiales bacterium]|nr:hypothetical protein [Acidimicrobiales bacterium]
MDHITAQVLIDDRHAALRTDGRRAALGRRARRQRAEARRAASSTTSLAVEAGPQAAPAPRRRLARLLPARSPAPC